MTLHRKTVLTIAGLLGALLLGSYAVLSKMFVREFLNLERRETMENVQRALDAIHDEVAKINFTATDWAEWDDTYAYVEDRNAAYQESNLGEDTLDRLKLSAIMYVHASGQPVFVRALVGGVRVSGVPEVLSAPLAPGGLLLRHGPDATALQGLLPSSDGPLMIAARPILTSAGTGPARGTLLFGRTLDASLLHDIAERVHLSVTLFRVNDPMATPDVLAAADALRGAEQIVVTPLNAERIAGYAALHDLQGRPAFLMRIEQPRAIVASGQVAIRYASFLLLICGLSAGGLMLWVLERSVLSRLIRLHHEVAQISAQAAPDLRVQVQGRDELASLAEAINQMLHSLARSMQDLQRSQHALAETNTQLAQLNTTLDDKIQQRTQELVVAKTSLEAQVVQRTQDLQQANTTLESKVRDLERLNHVMMDREERIVALKDELKRLQSNGGQPRHE